MCGRLESRNGGASNLNGCENQTGCDLPSGELLGSPLGLDHMQSELQKVREWADAKIASGEEPPWAWFQYMKLRETLDAILTGIDSTTTESSLQSAVHQETHLRLVASTDQRDGVPPRQSGTPTPLPM